MKKKLFSLQIIYKWNYIILIKWMNKSHKSNSFSLLFLLLLKFLILFASQIWKLYAVFFYINKHFFLISCESNNFLNWIIEYRGKYNFFFIYFLYFFNLKVIIYSLYIGRFCIVYVSAYVCACLRVLKFSFFLFNAGLLQSNF